MNHAFIVRPPDHHHRSPRVSISVGGDIERHDALHLPKVDTRRCRELARQVTHVRTRTLATIGLPGHSSANP